MAQSVRLVLLIIHNEGQVRKGRFEAIQVATQLFMGTIIRYTEEEEEEEVVLEPTQSHRLTARQK